jgi:hypothetical protein
MIVDQPKACFYYIKGRSQCQNKQQIKISHLGISRKNHKKIGRNMNEMKKLKSSKKRMRV